MFAREGQLADAIKDLETVVAIDPAFVNAYRKLAQLYTQEKLPDKASAALAKERAIKEAQSEDDRNGLLREMGYPVL